MRPPLKCRAATFTSIRQLHATSASRMPRKAPSASAQTTPGEPKRVKVPKLPPVYDPEWDPEELADPDGSDSTSFGHLMMRQQRWGLYFLRRIEHEMPQLVAFRKPFQPPDPTLYPLIVRSMTYIGEDHPASAKRAVVVPLATLPYQKDGKPLTGEDRDIAIHKMKLLAGVRWSKEPPKDAGVGSEELPKVGEHGFVKISCEDFPEPTQNLKWASDALDRLLRAATHNKKFANIPLDTRHLEAKTRKAKKGDHVYAHFGRRPSLKDFPKEWLQDPKAVSVTNGQ